jgi:hypothetical protein
MAGIQGAGSGVTITLSIVLTFMGNIVSQSVSNIRTNLIPLLQRSLGQFDPPDIRTVQASDPDMKIVDQPADWRGRARDGFIDTLPVLPLLALQVLARYAARGLLTLLVYAIALVIAVLIALVLFHTIVFAGGSAPKSFALINSFMLWITDNVITIGLVFIGAGLFVGLISLLLQAPRIYRATKASLSEQARKRKIQKADAARRKKELQEKKAAEQMARNAAAMEEQKRKDAEKQLAKLNADIEESQKRAERGDKRALSLEEQAAEEKRIAQLEREKVELLREERERLAAPQLNSPSD